jgi:hypothetical protein
MLNIEPIPARRRGGVPLLSLCTECGHPHDRFHPPAGCKWVTGGDGVGGLLLCSCQEPSPTDLLRARRDALAAAERAVIDAAMAQRHGNIDPDSAAVLDAACEQLATIRAAIAEKTTRCPTPVAVLTTAAATHPESPQPDRSTAVPHLWEIDHPYYPAEGRPNQFDSFAELREAADGLDGYRDFIYRWDWNGQELVISFVLQCRSRLMTFTCPVTHADEPAVREWLAGPRVLGHLRKTWAPLLDEPA